MRILGKDVFVYTDRGFESRPFRQFTISEFSEVLRTCGAVASPAGSAGGRAKTKPPFPFRPGLALPTRPKRSVGGKWKREGKPPKNLKKCRLELYFGQKRAFRIFID